MSKIISFEVWNYNFDTQSQYLVEFDDSVTTEQILKLKSKILKDYSRDIRTDETGIELDEDYIYKKCNEFCMAYGLTIDVFRPDIVITLDA